MIVPDFGVSADDKAMVALMEAIENRGEYAVKIVDLPAVVRDEHTGEELTESKVIELAARKLEQLSTCSGLKWDGSDYEWGAPTAIIVFGKSAMLAGGLGQKIYSSSILSMTRSGRGRNCIMPTKNLPGSIIAISTNMSVGSWRLCFGKARSVPVPGAIHGAMA